LQDKNIQFKIDDVTVRWFSPLTFSGVSVERLDLVIGSHQQVREQFFALDFVLGHPKTNVQQIIAIQFNQFFLQQADRGGFHDGRLIWRSPSTDSRSRTCLSDCSSIPVSL